MIYKNFLDLKLSSLGMGCMRFPVIDGKNSVIDIEKTKEMIAYCIENGINYFDTAWGYHDGQSEIVIGEILKDYPRESFYLADKFPGYDVSNMDKIEEIFPEQLRKCRVDYFDFYLFHCVCEGNINEYLDPKYGIFDYLTEQKKNGKIKHLGFSAHANLETLKRFLDAYGEGIEFCQLQINWIDWDFQNAKESVELVSSYNIPIWVMEPVRGGSLVNIAPEYENKLRSLRPDAKTVEWAFRFLQTIPQVAVTLSGMSDFNQVKENISVFESEKPLNNEEMNTLLGIAEEMTSKKTLHCTGCKYCTSYCPQELDIPNIIKLYNKHIFSDDGFVSSADLAEGSRPDACIGCKSCEGVCPQNIKISEMMSDFTENLR